MSTSSNSNAATLTLEFDQFILSSATSSYFPQSKVNLATSSIIL